VINSLQAGRQRGAKSKGIAADLARAIVSGELVAGEKLPPQRLLARQLGVTLGTVSRAYAELERRSLAYARVGDGTYVRHMDALASENAGSVDGAIDLANNVAVVTAEVDALRRSLGAIAVDEGLMGRILGYQPEAGAMHHRAAGAHWLRRLGTSGDPARVMVTHGAQHAIAAVLRAIARPGDTVLTEALSYPGLIALAQSMRLQLIGVAIDNEGLEPAALDRAARTFRSRLLFCSPTLHNPTGATQSLARRHEIAEIARRRSLLVIEDAVHAVLCEQPPAALSTLLPDRSFLIASLSKAMAPGLRVGYLEAAQPWLDKVAASIRTDLWMMAPLMAEIATRWIDDGDCERLMALQREAIQRRQVLARRLLAGQTMRMAPDFPHLWLELPVPWRAGTFMAALRQAGVLVRGPEHFAAGRIAMPPAVRISLNKPATLELLRNGLVRIRQCLRDRSAAETTPRTAARPPGSGPAPPAG
jgi:DNA-binding transcriptional MocR family regulator